ncbi:hypothetical protein N7488_001830 [Penicillium malachiteum]|nr:hypothetical protein N7488_001830 [Penicillium malachiteum]
MTDGDRYERNSLKLTFYTVLRSSSDYVLAKEVARLSLLAGGSAGVAFGAISVANLGGVALGWDRVFPVAFVALFALVSVPQGILEDKRAAVWRSPLT